ncbi:anthranilate synthase component I [Saccharibacillus sp. CPCC 101409]|uniref:anthranilate synthase component I n=1 Tax=Saccharibacillus sp. CPCC 101409 TaxID=3058041 RepID=UPI002673448B|nr:anthranilate synthase component I [Saccharibacillus sp. CPCC 101409]MDO3412179.1 anthranilate synthase component I [Saccharibacillus sp. CPCC 101409]
MKFHATLSPQTAQYATRGHLDITRRLTPLDPSEAVNPILAGIDNRRGALFTSGYEFPGRYSRWDVGFLNPPIELRSSRGRFEIQALNERGLPLLDFLFGHLSADPVFALQRTTGGLISGSVLRREDEEELLSEEDRTRRPSIFTLIRSIKDALESPEDSQLGLYGGFGYDLVFQFEPMPLKHERTLERPDIVLYLPDEITVVDRQLGQAYRLSYDFAFEGRSTEGLDRGTPETLNAASLRSRIASAGELPAYVPGRYAKLVDTAIEQFKVGNLFEVVPTQTLYEPCPDAPSAVFRRLSEINPSPYGFIVNLGTEHLVGSSPEMYVRVEGKRMETCPISGTIKRGASPIEDAEQIRRLLNSRKDEAELNMCTDVDRNDKSRVCEPGSVNVIGHRQIETYSHLFHTVDHVEGTLRDGYDALDAFMTHMWAVTVTGAPKKAAIQWIENHEDSPRDWYGGAVGYYSFDGSLNTGLTLRTIRIKGGVAEIRVGATLLYDSVPAEEEEETLTKGAALVKAVRGGQAAAADGGASDADGIDTDANAKPGAGKRLLFVDHEDSFVHTLAGYFKETGADVLVQRTPSALRTLRGGEEFDGVVLSPGPGRPDDFRMREVLELALGRELPLFGVCLGLQGIVEYYGGSLGILDVPQHGKPATVETSAGCPLFAGIDEPFKVGRYHSLYAEHMPDCLEVTARSEDGVVMGVRHRELPVYAVQFHPESLLTAGGRIGHRIIDNFMRAASRSEASAR